MIKINRVLESANAKSTASKIGGRWAFVRVYLIDTENGISRSVLRNTICPINERRENVIYCDSYGTIATSSNGRHILKTYETREKFESALKRIAKKSNELRTNN